MDFQSSIREAASKAIKDSQKREQQSANHPASQVELGGTGYVASSFKLPKLDVHVLMPKDIAKHHGDPSAPEVRSFTEVRKRINDDVEWVVKMAIKGEWEAIQILRELGVDCAASLGFLAEHGHKKTKDVAANTEEWPVVISPVADHPQNLTAFRKLLALGCDVDLSPARLLKQRSKFNCELAFHVLQICNSCRRGHACVQKNAKFRTVEKAFVDVQGADLQLRLIQGELQKNNDEFHRHMALAMSSKEHLIRMLPVKEYPSHPTFESLVNRSMALPIYDSTTEETWFGLACDWLDLFSGGKMERHPILRNWGKSEEEFLIRKKERTTLPVTDEMRLKYADDPAVNNEIRGEILKKLRVAMRCVRRTKRD